MSSISYIGVIERYHEYRDTLHELLASIVTGIVDLKLLEDDTVQLKTMKCIQVHYPFINLFYTLNPDGIQTSDNLGNKDCECHSQQARGIDRSSRPYYRLAQNSELAVVTEPYLSSANRQLCISATIKLRNEAGEITGYIVVDSNLAEIIDFLMGDNLRRRFQPFFKSIYGLIAIGLFSVVGVLLFSAFTELATLFTDDDTRDTHMTPFGVIIFLTLGLAVFDLGKTTIEEEVLMHKDIFRHSSTRRTITRFTAAILIAVSIEALLMMFKAAMGKHDEIMPAVWMMLSAVGLLIGLGLYVYFGARAEAILLSHKKDKKSNV